MSLVGIAIPLIQRAIVNNLTSAAQSAIWPLAVALLVAAVANFGGLYVRRYRGGRLSLDVQYDLRTDLFSALSRLDGTRQDELHTGQMVSRSICDVTHGPGPAVVAADADGQRAAVRRLAGRDGLPLPAADPGRAGRRARPSWFIALPSRRNLFPASWDAQQQAGGIAAVVEEAVTGVRVVKGFGQEEQEVERIERASTRLFAARMRAVRLLARYNPALQAVPALGQVGVLALGGWLALHGTISLGTFLAFSTYLVRAGLAGPVAGRPGHHRPAGPGQRERVFEVIDAEPVVTDRPDARAAAARHPGRGAGRREVRLRAVAAGAARPVAAGRRRARRWPSSARRARASPRSRCCCRVSTTSAAARCGSAGTTSATSTQDSLRSAIGMVFEDSFLFSDTVARPTSRSAGRTPPGSRSWRRRGRPRPTASSPPCRRATTRWSASRGSPCPAGSASGWPWPAPCSPTRAILRARRRHVRGRPAGGGGDPRDAAAGHARPDHAAHRPPPLDPAAGRPDRGAGRRGGWSTWAATRS